jgi:hypothetical protein
MEESCAKSKIYQGKQTKHPICNTNSPLVYLRGLTTAGIS